MRIRCRPRVPLTGAAASPALLDMRDIMQDPLVSVIIPASAAADAFPQCLKSILAQKHEKKEVIVVWAGRDAPDLPGKVRLVTVPSGATAAQKANAGLSAARGSVLALLQPHCLPQTDRWIEKIIADFADESVGAVVSQCAMAPDQRHTLAARLLHSVSSPVLRNRRDRARKVHLVGNLCDAYRARALAEVGLMRDGVLPAPGEAVDLSVSLAGAGYSIVLSPTAEVLYRDPPQTRSLRAVLRMGIEHGYADALIGKMHGVDWLGSRLYGAALLAMLLLPAAAVSLPVAFAAALALLLWGMFLPLRIPVLRWEWPAAAVNLALYVAIVFAVKDEWLLERWPPPDTPHPAIARQWELLAAMVGSYGLILLMAGVQSALRDALRLRGRASAFALVVLGALWWALSGLGFLWGYLLARAPSDKPPG